MNRIYWSEILFILSILSNSLPEVPLALCDDVDAEQQVRYGVGGDAVPDVASADHQPSDQAEPDGGGQELGRVHQHRDGSADDGGQRRQRAERHFPPGVLLTRTASGSRGGRTPR